MEAKFEKKLKAFLPYIIIIGIVFLIAPALLFVGSTFVTYLVLIGILPLTAGACCAHYAIKKENDFWLCLVAPIFFIPSMFIYGIFQKNALIALIYLVAYLLCGYLGLTIGDIVASSSKKGKASGKKAEDEPESRASRSARKPQERKPSSRRSRDRGVDADTPIRRSRSSARAGRVDLDSTDDFFTEDPYADDSLDTATTSEDVDAILSEIQQRRND